MGVAKGRAIERMVADGLDGIIAQPFDRADEDRFAAFIQSIGVILETQTGLGRTDRS